MRKLQLLVLSLTFFVPLSQAQGQPCSATNRENCVYVSTLTGNRIYRFDASTKAATVVNDGARRAVPELPAALVEGPDKLVYYADVSSCAVRRFDPFASVGANGLNSTLETVLPDGSICPAGLTFDIEGNLYANANSQSFTGVHEILKVNVQGNTQTPVSKVPLGELNGSATAVALAPAPTTNSTAAGIIFSNSGDLLFVVQSPDSLNPPFAFATPLSNPVGIVQDNAGKIFIANQGTKNIVRCDPDKKKCDEFATFADSADRPAYLDTNSEGDLLVATEQIISGVGKNGKIWLLTGPGPCPGTSCKSAGSIPKVNGKLAPAYGIGLSTTSALRSATFGPGPDGAPGTADDIADQTFNFGASFFRLTYPSGVKTPHTVTVQAWEVFPGDLDFRIGSSEPSETHCTSYHGKKGKCVVYELVDRIPTKDDYVDTYSVYIRYSGQNPTQPAILHDSRSLQEILREGPDFQMKDDTGHVVLDNLFNRYDQGPPGVDPGTGGKTTNNFTAYVSADLGAPDNVSTASYVTPIDATQITVVKRGRGLPVKISISDALGNTVTNAIVRLGVARIDGNSIFPDEVRSNTNFENRFRVQSNVYLYDLTTDDLALGLHVLTAAPDRDSPTKFLPLIAVIDVRP